jgi:CubicO group peptidase (beta-lactamase class C family)
MQQRILTSELTPKGKYIYSDNDFIFLGKVIEALSGYSLDQYVQREFYRPMGLTTAGFLPLSRMALNKIVPTEKEKGFRNQLLQGDVHDPGAAMFGGVAGHAGLFSNAYDIAAIMQMLLDNGTYNGRTYLQPETVQLFTKYQLPGTRRGLGFDKPERDNTTRKEPYPASFVSDGTFGHTGFTGTCTWADPKNKLIYVFLSNRVSPDGGANLKLSHLNVRPTVHDAIYKAVLGF